MLRNWFEEHLKKKFQGQNNSEDDFIGVSLSKLKGDAVMGSQVLI